MKILVFAHKGEAKSFISGFNLKKETISNLKLFSNPNIKIIITGEGYDNVFSNLEKLIKILQPEPFEIINMGIAGSLNDQIKIDKIYSIGLVKNLFIKTKENIMLTSDKESKICCLSVNEVLSSVKDTEKLTLKCDIIDMELWGIAEMAYRYNIPFYSYKYISDDARLLVDKKEIIKKADQYSRGLFNFFNKLL